MEPSANTLAADQAKRRISEMLEKDGLSPYAVAIHDPEIESLQVTWTHGLSLHFDLSCGVIEPFDDLDRRAILGLGLGEAFPLPADQLIDLAWSLDRAQLREAFGRLRDEGLLCQQAVFAERARVTGSLLRSTK